MMLIRSASSSGGGNLELAVAHLLMGQAVAFDYADDRFCRRIPYS